MANWTSLGVPGLANLAQFTTSLTVGCNLDGRLELFALGADGQPSVGSIWHTWQTMAGDPQSWTGKWVNRGRPHGIGLVAPVVASNLDGRFELFATSPDDGALWHTWQTAPNNGWPPPGQWTSRGQPKGVKLRSVTVGHNADGRLEVFAASGGAVWHTWQAAPNDGWAPPSAWTSRGKPVGVDLGTRLAVVLNLERRLEVFASSNSDDVWHVAQSAPNDGWPPVGTWLSTGHPVGLRVADPVIGWNADGRLELVVSSSDKNGTLVLAHTWQNAPGVWSKSWASFGQPAGTNIQLFGHAVASNADGRLEVFAVGDGAHAIWHTWQLAPNDGWRAPGDWIQLGRPSPTGMLSPVVFTTPDGRLEVFAAAVNTGEVFHTWQTKPNGAWH